MSEFDTGDNAPTHKGILLKVARLIEAKYTASNYGPLGDPGGFAAYRMQSPNDRLFFLISKASRLWVPKSTGRAALSIQKSIIRTADQLDTPILLAFVTDERNVEASTWFLFEPAMILRHGWAENERSPRSGLPSTPMLNFPFEIGMQIDEPLNIRENYKRLKEKNVEYKQTRLKEVVIKQVPLRT